jgi:hypothetical protein
MTPNALVKYADIVQKHCQMVFSRFLSMTIFIAAENRKLRKTWPEPRHYF